MSGRRRGILALDDRSTIVPVSVAGGPVVQVCVDPSAGDLVASWFLEHGHDQIDEPVQRAFVGAVRAGDRVVDLGSHLGLFTLTAAALGASVIAVDANIEHTRLLSLAAATNCFPDVHVVNAAVTAGDGSAHVSFVPRSIHGHVLAEGAHDDASVEVVAVSVDTLLSTIGWDHVDLVKMDIEGSEIGALRGMEGLFATDCRPVIVIECNASMLGLQGSSVTALRTRLVDLGYELHLIDHLRPGVLVEAGPADVQPESASDLIAVMPADRGRLSDDWQREGPFTRTRLVARVLDAAAGPAAGYRRHSADLLREGPEWLRHHPLSSPAIVALNSDISAEVRSGPSTGTRSAGRDVEDSAPPPSGEPEDPILVWLEGVTIRRRRRAFGRKEIERFPVDDDVLLRDVSFHINRSDAVAVVCGDQVRAEHLLAALAGNDTVVARGRRIVRGSTATLSRAAEGLEPSLHVADNVLALGAFLGAHVPVVKSQLDEILEVCGLSGRAERPLHEIGVAELTGLVTAVALGCARPDLLLLGELPTVIDPALRPWLLDRAAHLQGAGTAVLQVVSDPASLVISPARALWFEGERLRSVGNAESVLGAMQLQLLGFQRAGHSWNHVAGSP